MSHINTIFKNAKTSISPDIVVFFVCALVSLTACIFFYSLGLHMSSSDGLSRMDIARKVTDSLQPGVGQFGSVWPFLPQLIMVPFVAITPLWNTGIAGMIMSSSSFIISGYALYKILYEITHDRFLSVIGCLIFITNINVLLLQTMGMSESLFIAFIVSAMYFLLRWVKDPTKALFQLIAAGICLAGASITRYEGIAFTFAAIFVIGVILLLKKYSYKTIEGIVILFSTIALFGLFLWCLYNAMIFHDPIYWARVYAGQNAVISSEVAKTAKVGGTLDTSNASYISKVSSYFLSIAEMAGLPMFVLGLVGSVIYILTLRPFKRPHVCIVLLPLSIVGFMLVTFYKSTLPVTAPFVTLHTIGNFALTYASEYNIRYGILLWPFLVLMNIWLLSRIKILRFFAIVVLLIHIATPLYHQAFLQYQLPFGWSIEQKHDPTLQAAKWMKANYTGGLILISALKNDPTMFRWGYPYKTYIHEGTGKYWLTAIDKPQIYAQWIYMTDPQTPSNGEEDPVTEYMTQDPTLSRYYIERYNDGAIDIYERRIKPLAAKTSTNDLSKTLVFSGKIVDTTNHPLAKVLLSNGSSQTFSDTEGVFTLPVTPQTQKIVFQKQGYQPLAFTLNFALSQPNHHIIMLSPITKPTISQEIFSYL